MMGHNEKCEICNDFACGEEDGFDMPAPKDYLCRECRKAVQWAKEQRNLNT